MLITGITSLVIMHLSLSVSLNQTSEMIHCLIVILSLIVSDSYALLQSWGQKRHSQRPPARLRYGRYAPVRTYCQTSSDEHRW